MKKMIAGAAAGVAVVAILVSAGDLNTVKGRQSVLLKAESKKSQVVKLVKLLAVAERFKQEFELLQSKPGYEKLVPKEFLEKSSVRLAEIDGYRRDLADSVNQYNSLAQEYNSLRKPLVSGNTVPERLEPIDLSQLENEAGQSRQLRN
jgi:hypothetical protein